MIVDNQKKSIKRIPLKIFDETLRDGEQQAGLFFSNREKRKLAHLIAEAGVPLIDIMPFIDESETRLLCSLVSEDDLDQVVCPAVMTGRSYIEQAKACGARQIIMFHAVSDRLLLIRDPELKKFPDRHKDILEEGASFSLVQEVRARAKEKIIENLRIATSPELNLKVHFAAEDASRADLGFLVDCINEFRPYLGHFMLCDTVGMLSPEGTFTWVENLIEATDHAPLALHFHNDRGMALENTIQGILAGATMVSGTFNGIGERAGNVALEQVIYGLRARFGLEIEGIDYNRIDTITNYLQDLGAMPQPPYSRAAGYHESGIHVQSMLHDRKSYSALPYQEFEVWFGKTSGASNFKYLFEQKLKQPLAPEIYQQMRDRIKALSIDQARSFSETEVIELYKQGLLTDSLIKSSL